MNNSDSAAEPAASGNPVKHVSKAQGHEHDHKLYGRNSPKPFLLPQTDSKDVQGRNPGSSRCGKAFLKFWSKSSTVGFFGYIGDLRRKQVEIPVHVLQTSLRVKVPALLDVASYDLRWTEYFDELEGKIPRMQNIWRFDPCAMRQFPHFRAPVAPLRVPKSHTVIAGPPSVSAPRINRIACDERLLRWQPKVCDLHCPCTGPSKYTELSSSPCKMKSYSHRAQAFAGLRARSLGQNLWSSV